MDEDAARSMILLDSIQPVFNCRWNEKYQWRENDTEKLESGEVRWNDNGEMGESRELPQKSRIV